MKAWAIEFRGSEGDGKLYWAGGDETWSNDLQKAVLLARQESARVLLDSMPLLRGRVVEVTLTEGLQPVEKKNGDEPLPSSD